MPNSFNASSNLVQNGIVATVRSDGGPLGGVIQAGGGVSGVNAGSGDFSNSDAKLAKMRKNNVVQETRATPGVGGKPDPNQITYQGLVTGGFHGVVTDTTRVTPGDPRGFREVAPSGVSFINNGNLSATRTDGNTSTKDDAAKKNARTPYSVR